MNEVMKPCLSVNGKFTLGVNIHIIVFYLYETDLEYQLKINEIIISIVDR